MQKAKNVFQSIYKGLWQKMPVELDSFEKGKTALVIMDMVNGFVREGKMRNPLAEDLIEPIVGLMRECKKRGFPILAFGDMHQEDSPEFSVYEKHCVQESSQTEVVSEIRREGGYELIHKNSTNGFLEEAFQEWMKAHSDIDSFIVVGVCTDICVMQFCLTLKAWFNKQDKASRILVPLDGVETYDVRMHNITLTNTMAAYFMEESGIEVALNLVY